MKDMDKGQLYCLNIIVNANNGEKISKNEIQCFCHEWNFAFMNELKREGYIDFAETKMSIKNLKITKTGKEVVERYLLE